MNLCRKCSADLEAWDYDPRELKGGSRVRLCEACVNAYADALGGSDAWRQRLDSEAMKLAVEHAGQGGASLAQCRTYVDAYHAGEVALRAFDREWLAATSPAPVTAPETKGGNP